MQVSEGHFQGLNRFCSNLSRLLWGSYFLKIKYNQRQELSYEWKNAKYFNISNAVMQHTCKIFPNIHIRRVCVCVSQCVSQCVRVPY